MLKLYYAFIYVFYLQDNPKSVSLSSHLQMETQRYRQCKQLTQNHTAGETLKNPGTESQIHIIFYCTTQENH